MKIPSLLVPVEEQALRFARLFVAALVTQVVAINGHVDRALVISAVIAAAETAWKEFSAQAKNLNSDTGSVVAADGGTDLGETNPPDPNVNG